MARPLGVGTTGCRGSTPHGFLRQLGGGVEILESPPVVEIAWLSSYAPAFLRRVFGINRPSFDDFIAPMPRDADPGAKGLCRDFDAVDDPGHLEWTPDTDHADGPWFDGLEFEDERLIASWIPAYGASGLLKPRFKINPFGFEV